MATSTTKADELLRELVAAWEPEDGLRFVTAIRKARAYLNEKPHEPIKDAGGRCLSSQTKAASQSGQSVAPASPPHAAAEPEKPMTLAALRKMELTQAQVYKARQLIEAALPEDEPDHVPDWVLKLLVTYGMSLASPSAQPIARVDAIDDVLLTLRHARVFITSREKMHPDGVELYDRLIAKLESGATLLRPPVHVSGDDLPRDADGRPVPYRPNKPAGQA